MSDPDYAYDTWLESRPDTVGEALDALAYEERRATERAAADLRYWAAAGVFIDPGRAIEPHWDAMDVDPVAIAYADAADEVAELVERRCAAHMPSKRSVRGCRINYATDVFDEMEAALAGAGDAPEALRDVATRAKANAQGHHEHEFAAWVARMAQSMEDYRSTSLLALSAREVAMIRKRRRLGVGIDPARPELRRIRETAPAYPLEPTRPECDARPPPTPERCRPAVMLTGPPATRRHPRARTT